MEFNKVVISIAAFILIPIVIFVFVLPKYQQITDLQASLVNKQAEYEGKFIYYSKIADILKSIQNKQDALDKVNTALPANFSYAPIVYFLQEKGTETGLLVKSITFSPIASDAAAGSGNSTDGAGVKDVIFTVDLAGNYQGLRNYIAALDDSARLFQVVSVNFSSNAGASASVSSGGTTASPAGVYSFELLIKTNTY